MSAHKNQSFPARLKFALVGLAHAARTERSFRVQLAALAAVLIILLLLRPGALWWAQLADELNPQHSPGIRVVKDCAAAGVLIAVLGALGVAVAFAVHLLLRRN